MDSFDFRLLRARLIAELLIESNGSVALGGDAEAHFVNNQLRLFVEHSLADHATADFARLLAPCSAELTLRLSEDGILTVVGASQAQIEAASAAYDAEHERPACHPRRELAESVFRSLCAILAPNELFPAGLIDDLAATVTVMYFPADFGGTMSDKVFHSAAFNSAMRVIVVPDERNWGAEELEFFSRLDGKRRLQYSLGFLEDVMTVCHEFGHLLQGALAQRHVHGGQLAFEHDASYAAGSLACALARHAPALLPAGLVYACTGFAARKYRAIWRAWSADQRACFTLHRDSFGAAALPESVRGEEYEDALKGLIAVGNLVDNDADLNEQLRVLYHPDRRNGDVGPAVDLPACLVRLRSDVRLQAPYVAL